MSKEESKVSSRDYWSARLALRKLSKTLSKEEADALSNVVHSLPEPEFTMADMSREWCDEYIGGCVRVGDEMGWVVGYSSVGKNALVLYPHGHVVGTPKDVVAPLLRRPRIVIPDLTNDCAPTVANSDDLRDAPEGTVLSPVDDPLTVFVRIRGAWHSLGPSSHLKIADYSVVKIDTSVEYVILRWGESL